MHSPSVHPPIRFPCCQTSIPPEEALRFEGGAHRQPVRDVEELVLKGQRIHQRGHARDLGGGLRGLEEAAA